MVLRARWEGIHQKVDIAGRVEILAADCYGERGRDTAGPDFREHPPSRQLAVPHCPSLSVKENDYESEGRRFESCRARQ